MRWARCALAVAAWALVAALLGQMLTVGMAVFVDPGWWAWHRTVVHWYDWLTPAMLALAFMGRTAAGPKWLVALAIGLLFFQYYSAGLHASPPMQIWAAAHPVTAALLFWTGTAIARHATSEWRGILAGR